MAWPLDNLGDYNDVRIDLQKFNGCKDALYKAIGDNAVNQAAPGLLVKGGLGGAVIMASLGVVAYFGNKLYKNRKKAINEEPEIKAAFDEMVESAVACEPRELTEAKEDNELVAEHYPADQVG